MPKAKSIRFPHHSQIRRLLGLNPSRLPQKQEERWFNIMGLRFKLCPPRTVNNFGHRTRSAHRLTVQCNVCGKWCSVGRFNQHQSKHPREQLSELSLLYLNTPYHEFEAFLENKQ